MEHQDYNQTEQNALDDPALVAPKSCPICGIKVSGYRCPVDDTPLVPEESTGTDLWDRYQYVGLIGSGGMGVIYKACQPILNKFVAIKMLHPHLVTPTIVRRFQQEGRALSSLVHGNIVTLRDIGITLKGRPYIVMDYLEGQPLSSVIENGGAVEVEKAMPIFAQIGEALCHAHRNQILHRDIKPSNVMLTLDEGNERVKLLDFGIAKILSDQSSNQHGLTKTGEAMGSPLYMSPEQVLGRPLDKRSDLYSFGCLMYEVLTGTPPFVGNSSMEVMMKHVNEVPVSLKEASLGRDIPPVLENIVLRCLKREPADRYQSVAELLEELSTGTNGGVTIGAVKAIDAANDRSKKMRPGWIGSKITYVAISCALAGAFLAYSILSRNVSGPRTNGPPAQEASVSSAAAMFQAASEYMQKFDFPAAERIYKRALAQCPDSARQLKAMICGGLGFCLSAQNKWEQAPPFLTQAVALDLDRDSGHHGSMLGDLGLAYRKLHKEKLAIPLLEQSTEILASQDSPVWKGKYAAMTEALAECYDFMGETTKAKERWQEVYALAKNEPNFHLLKLQAMEHLGLKASGP